MAKYHGVIGFSVTEETAPGVWEDTIVEKEYSGDVLSNRRSWGSGSNLNDDLTISSVISVVANQFLNLNLPNMKYITWMGHKWKITSIEPEYPRLKLTIGGIYNE